MLRGSDEELGRIDGARGEIGDPATAVHGLDSRESLAFSVLL